MTEMIVSNKIKTSLDDRRKRIQRDPKKFQDEQRAKKAPAVSTNKTQPATFKSGKIKGVDLSKMISTMDVEPKKEKKAKVEARSTKKRKSPGKKGKKSATKSSSSKKNVAPVSSKEVKQENKA